MNILRAVLAFSAAALPLAVNAATPTQINAAMEQTVEVHGNVVASSTVDMEGRADVDYCSGAIFRVSGSLITIATARHCVSQDVETSFFGTITIDVQPLYVVFADGSHGAVLPGTVTASAKNDVGYFTVLKTDLRTYHPVRVSTAPVVRGQRLFMLGDAEGQGWVYSEGYSTRASDPVRQGLLDNLPGEQTVRTFVCTGCGPGDSGAGIFDEKTGAYLGLMTAGGSDTDFFIPSTIVERDYSVAKAVSVPDLTMFLSSPSPSPSPTSTPSGT